MFLARRNLTAHPLRSILTALAIALGVAMMLAAAVIGQAASEQANNLAEASGPRIDLEVFARDDKPFSTDVLATIRVASDVELASPSLKVTVEIAKSQSPISNLEILGVDPQAYQSLHKPELANGAFLAEDNAIVVPAALAIRNGWRTGDEIQLGSGDRVAQVKLGGRLKTEAGTTLGATPSALVPLAIAQQLAGAPGQIDHIEIKLRAGADIEKTRAELASELGVEFAIAQVTVGGGPSFSTLTIQALLALVGVIILFAAGFVIANAFGMSITARLKEFGSLRTLGMTRRAILNLVLLEAGGLGAVGAVGGVLLGLGIAWVTLGVLGYNTTLNVPLWAVAFSPVMGLTVTLLSALLPAWQASRISPMEAVRAEGGQTLKVSKTFRVSTRIGGAALALIILGLGVFGLLGRPDLTTGLVVLLPSMVILLAAMALLMPALVAPVATLVQPLLQRWPGGTAGRLAADNLRRNPTRAALTAAAMTAGLTMIIAISGLVTAFFKGGLQVFVAQVHEDRVIWPGLTSAELRFDNLMEAFTDAPPQNPEMVARLEELEQTGSIELIDYDMAFAPPELGTLPNYPAVFAEPEAFMRSGDFNFIEGNPADALKLMQRGRAVLIAPGTAARLNVHVGDDVKVQTPKGEVAFTVAGVGGVWWVMAVYPYADGQTYFGVGEPTFLGIVAKAGPDKAAALQRVDAIVKDYSTSALNLNPADAEGLKSFDTAYDQLALVLNALLLMAVVVAALGVVNTLVISVTERKREIGMLRAIGATQRQVRQMVMAEGATLGLLSVIFAIALSLIILLAFILLVGNNGMASLGISFSNQQWVETFLGASRDMSKAALVCLFIAPLVAALAAYYPARQAAAMDVIDATRSEQLALQPPSVRREEGADIEGRALPRSLPLLLAQRALSQNQTRTILSILAIALGAAMTIAGDVIGGAIINALSQSEDVKAISGGVLGQIDPILKVIGLAISVAAGFLIFNTFLMSITQRRQQIGTLRSLGMTRAQVLRMVLVEALLVSSSGVALGVLLGPLMGKGLIALLKAIGSPVFTAFKEREVSLLVYALAIGFGMSVSLLAALVPAVQATRISPLVALRAESLSAAEKNPNRSGFIGLGLLLLITIYGLLSPPAVWIQPPYDLLLTLALSVLWILGIALALPASIGWLAQALRNVLAPRPNGGRVRAEGVGGIGILILDNLQRGRVRVLLTIASLAVGLTLIVGVAGFFPFYTTEIFGPTMRALRDAGGWTLLKVDPLAGPGSFTELDSIRLTEEQITEARALIGARGALQFSDFVIVPQLSYFYDTYFSFIIDPRFVRDSGTFYFQFTEGNWETALPILDDGCGLLLTPSVARKNNAQLYDTLTIKGKNGDVPCTIAGIGQTFIGASLIGSAARAQFVEGAPFGLLVSPQPNVDADALESDLQHFAAQNNLHLISMRELIRTILQVLDSVPFLFQGFLLLAVLAAALGMVNTTLLSVTERRQELGQLRAIGATRAQVRAIVIGEAALIGFIGGGVGLLAGIGLVALIALVYGGNAMGIANYQPYAALLVAVRPALLAGGGGLLLAPFVGACAAYFPARQLLSGSAIETLNPEQVQPITRQQIVSVFNRGSIQTRFVLGTSLLLLVVLASLIQVVVAHARNYFIHQLRDSGAAMVGWNATLVELSLPPDAQTIDLDQLAQAQGQSFDADTMLRFRSLIDDMAEGGLEQFVIADRDNVVVISFDQREMGDTLDPIADPQRTTVREETLEGERVPRLVAEAPLHNQDGDFVGSLRMTLRMTEGQDFLDRVRNILWAAGAVIAALGLLLSWALSLPFSRAAQRLGAQASRVSAGDYSPITRAKSSNPLISNTSIRTRLTLLMTFLVLLLVGGMGLLIIPIEREQLETTTREGMLTVAQWIGDFMSEGLAGEAGDLQDLDLAQILDAAQYLNFANLQELAEQTRGQGIAYLTMANTEGEIVLADKFALIGETGPTTTAPQITEGDWRDAPIWIASTPLRQGKDGEQIGTLSIGIDRASIETFLNEAQNLFWLTGLIAVLAGLLLAQALGGAVAAPVEELVSGTRRVAQGDLNVRFRTESRDELTQLGAAFNEMVAGLQERERLQQELNLAREIQRTLLPRALPALPGWHLSAHYQPAREVGGDFYDFIPLPDSRLGLVIADVAGKGIPAALVMATARSLLRAAALRLASPGAVLEQVNDLLHPDIPPNMFVTCLYAVLDPGSGRLQFANAGHDSPYQRRAGGVIELRARGMPLGALPGMRYEEREIQLAPADWVLFYTDGLVEAHNARREMFGFPRLKALLEGHRSSGAAMIPMLLDELRRFTGGRGEQEDDVALVVLERRMDHDSV